MAPTTERYIQRIDEVLQQLQQLLRISGEPALVLESHAFLSNALTIIQHLLGPEDVRTKHVQNITTQSGLIYTDTLRRVAGILLSLKSDLQGGFLGDLRRQIRAEVESDLLTQAQRLLDDRLKDPAAMLIGAVLEDALRQLCRRHDVPEADGIERMNQPLRAAGVYGLPQQQQVTAWAAIRNQAAHGRFNEYDINQVRLMHQGVTDFIARFLT